MNEVNRTLYIPLYGKAMVSRKGILLHDPTAEEIWSREGFVLTGKARSRWLSYYMGMRSAVFDRWLGQKMEELPGALVLHLGCGLDSRVRRLGERGHLWYDVDFPAVMEERRKYYEESGSYHMLGGDLREEDWLPAIPDCASAVVVMEGVSMYLEEEALIGLFHRLQARFPALWLLADCYTTFAARASKYKNPVNQVGVSTLYGVDDPRRLETGNLRFLREHTMTPEDLIRELSGPEQRFFRFMFAGKLTGKIYRLYEYGPASEG